MTQALAHPGAAIVQIYNPCLTFNDMRDPWGKIVKPLPQGHDQSDRFAAMALADSVDPLYTGVYYRSVRPTLMDAVTDTRRRAAEVVRPDIEELIQQYA